MTIIEPGATAGGLASRVKGILLKPDAEWAVIDAEPASVKGVYSTYAAPLAAIPPVCAAIGSLAFGHGALGVAYPLSIPSVAAAAVVGYLSSLAGVYVLALIIEALAPNFGGAGDRLKALKVAAYASTPAWVAGVFGLVPAWWILAMAGALYSLVLLYKGLPNLMNTPADKAPPYVGVVIVAAIVIQAVAAASAVGAAAFGAPGALAHNDGQLSGKVRVGGSQIDLAQLQAASKQLQATAKTMEAQAKGQKVDGAVQALPGEAMQAFLPDTVAGFARTEVENSSGGVAGLQGSNARGVYARGRARITLKVTDLAAAGGLAGLAAAFNVTSNKQTADGYEKVGQVDGRMTAETYDRRARSGDYAVMVGNRFMVQAQGSSVSMDDLKAAVAAVGIGRLEGMAKG